MPDPASSLDIYIFPDGIQSGMPGDPIEFYISVINKGNESAVITLYFDFDDEFQKVSGWSHSPEESLTLGAGETSNEVPFQLQIPVDAKPGTYDYTLVVDSPQYTPIYRQLQLKVQLKEQTVIKLNDPTFSLQPSSNTNKPLVFQPGQPLQVIVRVENRYNFVDRFRLTCPDLDDDWFTITYPTTGVESIGLTEVNTLELNPRKHGQIFLAFHPPADTLAGPYVPTIRLYSENYPNLVLLDLVYFEIKPISRLDVQPQIILAQVSRSAAKYVFAINNQGNVVHELTFDLETRDEDVLYTYEFQPREIKLLPSKSYTTNLEVKPRYWWRRPWFGAGLTINFQTKIQDKNSYTVPNIPQLSFVWKPRPLWQFLLLILLLVCVFFGTSRIIWKLMHPEPVIIETFAADSPKYIEGEEVTLKWNIKNYKRLKKLVLKIQGTEKPYDFSDGVPEELIQTNSSTVSPCRVERSEMSCENFKTGVKAKGQYNFELQGFYSKGGLFPSRPISTGPKTFSVEIGEKPIAEVADVKTDKPQYSKGENVNLSWKVSNYLLLRQIQVTTKTEDGTLVSQPRAYSFKQGKLDDAKLQNLCKPIENQQLECKNMAIPVLKAGKFTFEVKAFSNNGSSRNSVKKTESAIEILPKPFSIAYFTINGSSEPIQELEEGTTVTLAWKVAGEAEDIQVKLDPIIGNVKPEGQQILQVKQGFPSPLRLLVSDKFGKQQPQEKSIAIAVKVPPPEPILPPLEQPLVAPPNVPPSPKPKP
jgi:hypothetical protein